MGAEFFERVNPVEWCVQEATRPASNLLQVHLADGLLVHGVEPRTVTTLNDDSLDNGPMADEPYEPASRGHVSLARDPEDA